MELLVFPALYLNLFLCFGLGIRELNLKDRSPFYIVYPWFVVFAVTLLLWLFFEGLLSRIYWFPGQLMLYPLALFSGLGIETALFALFPRPEAQSRYFVPGSEYSCFSLASLFLVMHFAPGFREALLLSLAFSGGGLLVYFLTKQIIRRSLWETLPGVLKGPPLLFISLGLLSLVFSASALIILKAFLG